MPNLLAFGSEYLLFTTGYSKNYYLQREFVLICNYKSIILSLFKIISLLF